jgi:hypothetical protein
VGAEAVTLSRPKRIGREAGVFLAFLALTLLQTWPWVTHLRNAVSDNGDSYFSSWILWWDWHGTLAQPLHLFDANIFFPYRYTLAFAENAYGIALLFFPAFAAGLRPLTVHGLSILLGFTLSGYGAFRLTRTLTGSAGAGWVAGIGFAFVPYRFHHLTHFVYVFAGWMPLLLEALVLFVRKRSSSRALWLGAAFLMNGLTSVHWFVLSLLPLLLGGAFLAVRERVLRDRALWLRGALAIGGATVLLLPFLLPYRKVATLYHFERPAEEALRYSASPGSWLSVDAHNVLWRGFGDARGADELRLFPGLLLIVLPVTGLVLARKHAATDATAVGVIWTILGILGSFGMRTPFHGILFEWVPLFRSIRVPARWAMVAFVGLAVLAGLGALRLSRLFSSRRASSTVLAVLCLALLFELRTFPIYTIHGEVDPDEITLFLKKTPMKGGLVELPTTQTNYRYVLRAADHEKPLVNAYAGFEPWKARRIRELAALRPVPDELLDFLESIPTSYLAVHEGALSPEERDVLRDFVARGVASARLRFVGRFDGAAANDLYAVVKTEGPDPVTGGP